jgi:hypothetical protein
MCYGCCPLFLGVANRNALMFRGFRVLGRVFCGYEAASYCAAVNWFGWYCFCHCCNPHGLALQPLARW